MPKRDGSSRRGAHHRNHGQEHPSTQRARGEARPELGRPNFAEICRLFNEQGAAAPTQLAGTHICA